MPNYIFSMNIKHALFFGKGDYKIYTVVYLDCFSLNKVSQKYEHTYVAGYICRLRTGREDTGPPTTCIFTCRLVYFRIPFTELLCGR